MKKKIWNWKTAIDKLIDSDTCSFYNSNRCSCLLLLCVGRCDWFAYQSKCDPVKVQQTKPDQTSQHKVLYHNFFFLAIVFRNPIQWPWVKGRRHQAASPVWHSVRAHRERWRLWPWTFALPSRESTASGRRAAARRVRPALGVEEGENFQSLCRYMWAGIYGYKVADKVLPWWICHWGKVYQIKGRL